MASSKTRKGIRILAFRPPGTDALAKARDMIAEGDHEGADRHDGSFEIRDRANHHVLTVAVSEISKSKLTRKGGRC